MECTQQRTNQKHLLSFLHLPAWVPASHPPTADSRATGMRRTATHPPAPGESLHLLLLTERKERRALHVRTGGPKESLTACGAGGSRTRETMGGHRM